uniref:Uncharacterized protein n=1 Tax=Arundo donax TaxID=35708 RepID=A0A0A9C3K6_ARUDO
MLVVRRIEFLLDVPLLPTIISSLPPRNTPQEAALLVRRTSRAKASERV